jgi:hypothetical protein
MHGSSPPHTPERSHDEQSTRWDLRVLVAALVGVLAIGVAMVVTEDSDDSDTQAASLAEVEASGDASTDQDSVVADPGVEDPAGAAADPAAIAVVQPAIDLNGCTLEVTRVDLGDTGPSVECVQKALTAAGFYSGTISGTFDEATDTAARTFQSTQDLEVDGIVGGKTATTLGIWPGDESFVVRTPPPPAGAMDSWGYTLSSVATTGSDAPPMPENSGQGTGKRIVYDRAGQRVWAIDDEERVVRSYLVTGSQYNNETPGVHKVYSKSEVSTAWNGEAKLPLMVRYLDTVRGAIGFHGIPTHISDGTPYQTDAELGQKLSGGCQRQNNLDAAFMWAFADIGTTVIVT